jgi:hypothetical protein
MIKATKRSLLEYIKKVLHSSPLIVIKTYMLLYTTYCRIKSFWFPVNIYTGITHEGGDPLKFCYLGWDRRILSYWLNTIFNQYEQISYKKLIPVWKINKYLKDNALKCDLAMIELNNKLLKQPPCTELGFVLPRWLKMHMDVDLTLSLMGNQHFIRRRIRKHSLKVEKGFSEQDFAFFYKKMYKPYVESRHKDSAYVENYQKMLQDFKKNNSTIYFVITEGLKVAGLYEQKYDGIPYVYAFGVLDGSDEIMRMGVIGALYYFALTDHLKKDIKRVNIGGASPWLKDGLTQYKLLLGGKVSEMEHQNSLRLKFMPLVNSKAVKDFLTFKSFVYLENENMYCAIFTDETKEDTAVQLKMHYSQTNFMSIDKIKVFSFNSQNKLSEFITGA